MSTGRPVSTPVDHARWEEERKRLESISKDASGAFVKITDPILDSRWAVIFGGTLWLVLLGLFAWQSTSLDKLSTKLDSKLDATNEKLSGVSILIGQQAAGQEVLKVRFGALEQRVDYALENHRERIERLERK